MSPETEEILLRCIEARCRVARLKEEARPMVVWASSEEYLAFVDEQGLRTVLARQSGKITQPHSATDLGEFRELWWHADQLGLLGERLGLSEVESFVDLGCGRGYWTSLVLSLLAKPRTVVGIDQEPGWLERATARLQAAVSEREGGGGIQLTFLEGDVHNLPIESGSVDLATCQSVLMHARDPARVLSEMRRVVRPGGLILCVEPDRLLNYLPIDSVTESLSPEEQGDLCRFWHYCRLGRIARGEGDLALGSNLPRLFVEQGLSDVQVFQRDKAFPLLPPYGSEETRRWLAELYNQDGSQNLFDPERLMDWTRAGGAPMEFAERQVSRLLGWLEELRSEVSGHTYFSAGGEVMYVVSGRKPELQ